MKKITIKEADIQVQIVEYLELMRRKNCFLYFSVSNEAMGLASSGAGLGRMLRFRKMGMRHGVADLVVVKDGKTYFMELKTPKGVQSENQKEFEAECILVSACYSICRSVDEAIDKLRTWRIIE